MPIRTIHDYRQRAIAAQLARQGQESMRQPPELPRSVEIVPVVPVVPEIDPDAPVSQPRGRLRVAGVLPVSIAVPKVADLPALQVGLTAETEKFLEAGDPASTLTIQTTGFDPPVSTTPAAAAATTKSLEDLTLDDLPIGKAPWEDLSGTAGVGKTTLVRKLLELSEPGSVVLAATTGIAAVNLGEGTTIHSLLGFFDGKDLQEKYVAGRIQSMLRKHRAAGVRRIIIDEKSMLHGQALTVLTRAVEQVNQPRSKSLEAVGQEMEAADDELPPQIGITLCGDFGQLPPVPEKDPKNPKKNLPVQFLFESPEWHRYAAHRTILTKVWRQDSLPFITALHAVRRGDARAALEFFTPNRFADYTDDQFPGTTIYAKNDDVDRYNGLRLDQLVTPILTADATRWGKERSDWKNIPNRLTVKEGALVMILANRRIPLDDDTDPRRGQMIYANGDLGTVIGQEEQVKGEYDFIAAAAPSAWLVKIHRTGIIEKIVPVLRENTIPLEPGRRKELISLDQGHRIKSKEKQEIIGTICYMPLRVAYGCTVHKTQGLTLDNVQLNIRDEFWRHPGMAFVALSRARTAEGLRIVGNQVGFVERIRVEARCIPWL